MKKKSAICYQCNEKKNFLYMTQVERKKEKNTHKILKHNNQRSHTNARIKILYRWENISFGTDDRLPLINSD